MSQVLSKQEQNIYWKYNATTFSEINEALFTPAYWQARDAVTGQETGRGTTWFLKHKNHQLVLRHYLRGGLMRHISHDKYIYTGLQNTRSIAEFSILDHLLKFDLPVPRPAAAQVIKQGAVYKADLITHKIPEAQDLVQRLKQKQDADFYHKLGGVIAQFHRNGVYHADLNIQNILQDLSGQFWLIDFDRAKILMPQHTWQQANLKRLKRSFEKERQRYDICWQDSDWNTFHKGYLDQIK